MRSYLIISTLILTSLLSVSQTNSATPPDFETGYDEFDSVVILGGNLFTGVEDHLVENEGVWVSNGRLMKVNQTVPDSIKEESRIVELDPGNTILPGLLDLHAHYNMDLIGEGRIEEMTYNPVVYLANGVTTTFPAGEYQPERVLEAKNRINRGDQIGPRILNSGPYIGRENPEYPDADGAKVKEIVDTWAEKGVEGFKAKGANPEQLEALIQSAHRHGLTVTGHLDSGRGHTTNSVDAIKMGIDRVEHILGGYPLDREQAAYPVWNEVDTTDAEFRKIVDLFIDHRVNFDATLTAPVYFTELEEGFDYWVDEREFFTSHIQDRVADQERERNELMSGLYQAMLRTTKAFYDAGGGDLITLGTDAPSRGEFLPGFGAHRELHTFVFAGIPETSALRIATQNGAKAINEGELLGTLEEGKLADLFIIDGDPVEEITNTRKVKMVMKDGLLYDPEVLLDQVKGSIGPSDESDYEEWGW